MQMREREREKERMCASACVCVRVRVSRDRDLQRLVRVQVGDRIRGRKSRLEVLDTKALDQTWVA